MAVLVLYAITCPLLQYHAELFLSLKMPVLFPLTLLPIFSWNPGKQWRFCCSFNFAFFSMPYLNQIACSFFCVIFFISSFSLDLSIVLPGFRLFLKWLFSRYKQKKERKWRGYCGLVHSPQYLQQLGWIRNRKLSPGVLQATPTPHRVSLSRRLDLEPRAWTWAQELWYGKWAS